jgi:hypothetical protein
MSDATSAVEGTELAVPAPFPAEDGGVADAELPRTSCKNRSNANIGVSFEKKSQAEIGRAGFPSNFWRRLHRS